VRNTHLNKPCSLSHGKRKRFDMDQLAEKLASVCGKFGERIAGIWIKVKFQAQIGLLLYEGFPRFTKKINEITQRYRC